MFRVGEQGNKQLDHGEIIMKLRHVLIVLLLVTLFTGCKTDEPEEPWISLFHDNFEFTGTYYIPAPRIQIMQQLEDVVRYELYASRFEPDNFEVLSRRISRTAEWIDPIGFLDLEPGVPIFLKLTAVLRDGSEKESNIVKLDYKENLRQVQPEEGVEVNYGPQAKLTLSWENTVDTAYEVYHRVILERKNRPNHSHYYFARGEETALTIDLFFDPFFEPGEYTWYIISTGPTGWTNGHVTEVTAAAGLGSSFILK